MRTLAGDCCSQRVSHSMGDFGAPFCRGIEPFLANLQSLLSQCEGLGLTGDATVVSAQAVYDDINGVVVYVPLVGDACAQNTAEVQAAIAHLIPVVAAAGGNTDVPRPDAQTPSDGPPTWMIVAGIGVVGVLLLGQLNPIINLFAPKRRSTAGYRRRR